MSLLDAAAALLGVAITGFAVMSWIFLTSRRVMANLAMQDLRHRWLTNQLAGVSNQLDNLVGIVGQWGRLATMVRPGEPAGAQKWESVYTHAGVNAGDSFEHGRGLKEAGVATQALQDAGIEHWFAVAHHPLPGGGMANTWDVRVSPRDFEKAEKILHTAMQGFSDAQERLKAVTALREAHTHYESPGDIPSQTITEELMRQMADELAEDAQPLDQHNFGHLLEGPLEDPRDDPMHPEHGNS